MIKVFRCGDVLCVSPTSYDVCCALCEQRVPYEGFPKHFRKEHLTDLEAERRTETVTERETEDCKLFGAVDAPVVEVEVEPLAIKSEDDPIANDVTNETTDLAQIALIDREHESDEGTIATRRKRRAMLLQPKDAKPPEENVDWLTTEGNELNDQEHSGTDENYQEEDDARDMLFQCDQCERAYNTKRSLQSHKRCKHNERKTRSQDNPTSETVATAATCSVIERHKKQRQKGPAKIYKCNEQECNQTFRTERDLRGHRWKHTGIFCDICGKPFTQSGNMMRHRQRHSGIKPYKCQEIDCEATFYTQKELTSHSICHTGRMPCICEICGRPCRDRGVLTAHMRRHTGERPAKCEVCDKSFYSFHDLNVHAVSHTNLRPFVCDVCGSTFQRKKALRVHKLLHSEQRKYSCKLCHKAFAQSGGLNAHMRTHESTRAKGKTKSTSFDSTTTDLNLELATPIQIEHVTNEQELQEAVTIELIQEDHPSHVEVVAVATAGSWHVT